MHPRARTGLALLFAQRPDERSGPVHGVCESRHGKPPDFPPPRPNVDQVIGWNSFRLRRKGSLCVTAVTDRKLAPLTTPGMSIRKVLECGDVVHKAIRAAFSWLPVVCGRQRLHTPHRPDRRPASVSCRYWPEAFQEQAPCVGKSTSWLVTMATAIGIGSLAVVDGGRPGGQMPHSSDGDASSGVERPAAQARILDFPDGQAWTIAGGFAWSVGSTGAVVFVPQGFVHDRTSVPPALWSLASHTNAAVIHDYLYWAQPCSRLQSDNLLMIAMKQSDVPWLKRQLVYRAVRVQGGPVWRRNADERAIGMPRINPYGHVPDNLTWPQLRARMFHEGIRDVSHAASDSYCRFGDSQHVPGARG